MINRIFVEKKKGYDIEAVRITKEITEQLSLKSIKKIRVINRYDVQLSGVIDFKDTIYGIFAEINQDNVYYDELPVNKNDKIFGVQYQPGQYDIRCDSAAQCVKLLCADAEVLVKHAKIYVITGEVSETDLKQIEKYMINPVDSQLASLEKINEFNEKWEMPLIRVVLNGFINCSDEQLEDIIREKSLAMDMADIKTIRDYFKFEEKRDPTETELKVLDTYWSDHCRHTTFSTILNNISFGEGVVNDAVREEYENYLNAKKELGREDKPVTLMDIAVMGARYNKYKGLGKDIEESDENNACSYLIKADIDGQTQDVLLMFKNETHNHPTEIEPFGGAATCLGGAIRDPLSGRSYVYQSMRVTGCADPTEPIENTLQGKLPQRKITTQAASGFSSYGNQIGLCTGQVKEYYHPGYVAKRMEVGAVIAAAAKENVIREKPLAGDLIYVIGGRTGRDGIGGASGSSKEHNIKSVDTAGSEVQKGNAPEERKLQRLFRNASCAKLIKKCNDFGAGGVSVAIGELAESLDINLDTLLLKYEGLNATELAISESQERMAVVIDPKDEEKFLSFVREENLEYSKTAVVTDTGRLVMRFKNEEILNLKRSFIDTNGAKKYGSIHVDFEDIYQKDNAEVDFKNKLLHMAQDLNICSQKGLIENFDNTIGASTVLMPFGGKYMLTPTDVMVAKIPVNGKDTKTVSMMSHGFDPDLGIKNPYLSGFYAVVSCVSKLVCAGADHRTIKLSCQEFFEKLRNDPQRWAKPFAALLGALKVQTDLGISAIGGKDSMSGSFENLDVPPSIICFGAAAGDIDHVVSNEFKKSGSYAILLQFAKDRSGLIDLNDYTYKLSLIHELIKQGHILSAKAAGYGGIADAVMKMCLGNKLGFKFEGNIAKETLFDTDHAAIIIETDDAESLLTRSNTIKMLGEINDSANIQYKNEIVSIDELIPLWEGPLCNVFPIYANETVKTQDLKYNSTVKKYSNIKIAKPRVFIPVFPGTNCEYDTIKAFEKAGAVCTPFVFKNKTTNDILQSVEMMAQMIRNAQIIAFPGGFSAGDEPDGSGKFIVSVLKSPMITEAITDFMEKRDGLIVGICNGFQALIKTGLLPYGKICSLSEDSPTLTFNTIGRHVAKIVYTKLVSNKSVWFNEVEPGAVHGVALSHGEGRFAADEKQIKMLIDNGQIITQYCDITGKISGDPKTNPNGSAYNVEAISSPDGRILGKMGHSERTGSGLYQNINGDFDQKIFLSGVKYYS